MNFSWSPRMPYRWLPPDFRERYHGVWVDVPNRLYDPERGHELYNEYLDMLEYAGQMGFDGLGVNEHHQNAYGMMPSPNLMAAALARHATDSMLLVLGNSIALDRKSTRLNSSHLVISYAVFCLKKKAAHCGRVDMLRHQLFRTAIRRVRRNIE